MVQSEVVPWVPQVRGALTEQPDGGSFTLTHEQRLTVSIATLSRVEYEMERIAREHPELEIMFFDDVQNRELKIKWRRRNGSSR